MNNPRFQYLIPKPVWAEGREGVFQITPETIVCAAPGCEAAYQACSFLVGMLRSLTGWELSLEVRPEPTHNSIFLGVHTGPAGVGDEGYVLEVSQGQLTIKAQAFPGFLYACQTLRQLLPPKEGPWQIEGVVIEDYPRFAWRGAMLDVARSFFPIAEVKRLIDLFAAYKLNRLHLHLSDDQGWRIMIDSWPNLALHGGSGAVEGGRAGYFTKAEYKELAAYAQSRGIILVPEIDLPGHTNAALASYPELNRDGQAPELYRGMKVGFSTLAAEKEITYRFVRDVLGELAELTPGPYLHVGGDEAHSTTPEEYKLFMERVQAIVAETGKTLVGWDELIQAGLKPGSLIQIWRTATNPQEAVRQGAKLIMSPCHRIYLDMKYGPETAIGQTWAAIIEVRDAYDWDPTQVYPSVDEAAVLGVEAPVWTETIHTLEQLEYMFFPRLLGVAEIAWSPRQGRGWEEYRLRLASHGPRLAAEGVNFYPSPQIPWQEH